MATSTPLCKCKLWNFSHRFNYKHCIAEDEPVEYVTNEDDCSAFHDRTCDMTDQEYNHFMGYTE